jgi:uncharacterized protein
MNTGEKVEALAKTIAAKGSMLISFSGGVDSSLLAVLAREILGSNTRCVLLDSPVVPRAAVEEARQIADDAGLTLDIIPQPLMDDERFTANPAGRCYWCRKNAAAVLKLHRDAGGYACIADGTNVSDTGEYRPGRAAATEEGIVHPFLEAGITKADIREIARARGLDFWDKPSAACLASRIPYGEEITCKRLTMIEEAEIYMHSKGFCPCRVRTHGGVARVEVVKGDFAELAGIRDSLVNTFRAIGFSYVTLDLEGYRSGSMDEVLRGDGVP